MSKKMTGETTIKPMSDFDINKDRDVLKAYLNGRFGAVPVIKGGKWMQLIHRRSKPFTIEDPYHRVFVQ